MGQYLAIGLATLASVSKKELEQGKITQPELVAEMESRMHFDANLFDVQEVGDRLKFILTDDVLHSQLLPFLEEFYPAVYSKGALGSYPEALQRLRETEPSKWLELAGDKYFESFQLDEYGAEDHLYFDKPFRPSVSVYYKCIMLSLEGKVFMEMYGRQFRFFKYCMVQAFPKHPLAKALRVYITG